jgi:hypothetical protein
VCQEHGRALVDAVSEERQRAETVFGGVPLGGHDTQNRQTPGDFAVEQAVGLAFRIAWDKPSSASGGC